MAKSVQNPLIDLSNTTVQAFNIIKSQEKQGKKAVLGRDDNLENTTNHKVIVYVYTPQDKQKHTYFHSLSIDKQVEDFMGTAEIRCPYDSDLMEYWEPIRNYCIIYGSNKGEKNVKILFIGRVREIKQEGYEISITFQDYGWKFKQPVSQSYANDNVINKDGYTIMKLMFEALKIDSWVISPIAKKRLREVGYDQDGNVTLNKKKIEEMPDLIERLKKSDPNQSINKWTVYNKVKESKEGNVKNINYTLKYEKPTPVMKKISSEGSGQFEAGESMYGTNYGAGAAAADAAAAIGGGGSNQQQTVPDHVCDSVTSTSINTAMQSIWKFNREMTGDYSWAKNKIIEYAQNYPKTGYPNEAVPCLNTLAQYCTRKDGINAAVLTRQAADSAAATSKGIASVAAPAAKIVGSAGKAYGQFKKGDYWGAATTFLGGIYNAIAGR